MAATKDEKHEEVIVSQQLKYSRTMNKLFGFKLRDVSSWHSITLLLNRPADPASLGVMRFMFGFLMILDIPQERGLSQADVKWGDERECRFPLFDALSVPPLEWVYVIYFIMFLGAVGIMIGYLYRLSCLLFLVPYWYLFLLDKSSWNNHSYLYGLMAVLFLISDGNRYWSLDAWFKPSMKNEEIPLWNYTLFRIQIFLLYHIAGLKKFDQDWLGGYSMYKLSEHWVFTPFKILMSGSSIDYFVVHLGGFFLDLTIGFFMFFDATRILAFLFCAMFNLMNSQMFTIGMFPYTMLAMMPAFCHTDWPRTLVSKCFPCYKVSYQTTVLKPSLHCLYSSPLKDAPIKEVKNIQMKQSQPIFRHKAAVVFTATYILIQLFLPYSHFITKGYNTWTNGLYGYSWDMMIHSWNTLHTRIRVVDKDTGHEYYLDPERWASRDRWTAHADMAKQYAHCMKRNLEMYGLTNVSIYMDIWKSLNRRFQQRIFRPDVDILTAEWSPFTEVTWVMPLLSELTRWRAKLSKIEAQLDEQSRFTNVVFFADIPGQDLHNFVADDIANATFEVLEGKVLLTLPQKNITLSSGEKVPIPSGTYHTVHTISDYPSCFFYTYFNTTEKEIFDLVKNGQSVAYNLLPTNLAQAVVEHQSAEKYKNMKLSEKLKAFWLNKFELFRSVVKLVQAMQALAF